MYQEINLKRQQLKVDNQSLKKKLERKEERETALKENVQKGRAKM